MLKIFRQNSYERLSPDNECCNTVADQLANSGNEELENHQIGLNVPNELSRDHVNTSERNEFENEQARLTKF